MKGIKVIRTTLNVERNQDTNGWDVVIRLGYHRKKMLVI